MRFTELPEECKLCKKCIPISFDSEGTKYKCSEHMDTGKIGGNCIAKHMFDK